jgi:hypothetical protein
LAPPGGYSGIPKVLGNVIRSRVKAVYFNEGWEYSNGCVYEFSVAAEVGLPTFDSAAGPISADQAVERVARVVRELEAEGLDTTVIRSSLDRITLGLGHQR